MTKAEAYLGVTAKSLASKLQTSDLTLVSKLLALLHSLKIRPHPGIKQKLKKYQAGICQNCSKPVVAQGRCAYHLNLQQERQRRYYYMKRGRAVPDTKARSGRKNTLAGRETP